jgi:DNA replicative helicase MCM subunit Mcm2 (Cdc46/Mcm family)
MNKNQKSFWSKFSSEMTVGDQVKIAGVVSAVTIVPALFYAAAKLCADCPTNVITNRKAYKELKKTCVKREESV